MSYRELAQNLQETAQSIMAVEEHLQGEALAKVAVKLQKVLTDFHKTLESLLNADKPENLELIQMLQGDTVRNRFSDDAFRSIFKVITDGKILRIPKTGDIGTIFLQNVQKLGLASEAMRLIRHHLNAVHDTKKIQEEDDIRNEIVRLGGLAEKEWELEVATTLSIETLQAIANLMKIKYTKKTKLAILAKKIRPIAVNFFQNVTY